MPDRTRINYPKAIIELKRGFEPLEKLKEDIQVFCKGKLPEYQIPDEIEFVMELPRTDREKIDCRTLEKQVDERA